jgi:hypothetical protein
VEPLTEPKEREQTVMSCGEMAHQIVQTILARRYLKLEFIVAKRSQGLASAVDDKAPRLQDCADK